MMANSLQEDLAVAADTFMAQFLGERNWSLWLQLRDQNGFDNNHKFTAWILATVESFIASTESDCSIVMQKDDYFKPIIMDNDRPPLIAPNMSVVKKEEIVTEVVIPAKTAKRRKSRKPVVISNNNSALCTDVDGMPVYDEDVRFNNDNSNSTSPPRESDSLITSASAATTAATRAMDTFLTNTTPSGNIHPNEDLEIVESYVDESGVVSYRSKPDYAGVTPMDACEAKFARVSDGRAADRADVDGFSDAPLEIDDGPPPLLPVWSPDTTVPSSVAAMGQSKCAAVTPGRAPATYTCEWCGKVLTDRSNLSRHIKTVHLRVKGHRCSTCGKQFTRSDNYRAHLKTPCGVVTTSGTSGASSGKPPTVFTSDSSAITSIGATIFTNSTVTTIPTVLSKEATILPASALLWSPGDSSSLLPGIPGVVGVHHSPPQHEDIPTIIPVAAINDINSAADILPYG